MFRRVGDLVTRVSFFAFLLHGVALAAPPEVTVTKQRVDTAAGLHTVTFDTLQGTVTVNLPDDLAAGDTISGTVLVDATGATPADVQRNQDSLSGTVVEMDKQSTAASDPGGRGRWLVPATAAVAIPLILRDRQGRTIGKVDIPVAKPQPKSAKPPEDFQVSATGQTGRPVSITGPFDGDFRSTAVRAGETAVDVLAESPRKLIARSPAGLSGAVKLEVTKGEVVTRCEYRNLNVKLSALRLNMKSGERTTMTVTVDGVGGMLQSVPLTIVNKSPGVVHVQDGDLQRLEVDPRNASGDVWTATRGLIGVMPGGFNITASIAPESIPSARCTTTSTATTANVPPIETFVPPGAEQKRMPAQPPAPLGRNWDFEEGLSGWTATGDAFDHQPTLGDNVLAARVRSDMTLERGGIGGDYWKRIPYPIGHHLDAWVGTNENHPDASAPLGAESGGNTTGTLTSGDFPLDDEHRFIAFVIGGGGDVASERVELQVRGDSDADLVALEGTVGTNRGAYSALAALFGGTAGGTGAVPSRDGDYVIALTASGRNTEVLRPVVIEVPSTLRGRFGRIRIVDNAGGAWGHINVDDFRFGAARPPDRHPPLWGFADTHSHPMNDLAFGGGVVQGSLYARDGSRLGTDANRRSALPPLFENLHWDQLGAAAGLLSPFYAGGSSAVPGLPPIGGGAGAAAGAIAREATRSARMGYPDMHGYPSFDQMAGQQMYGEWIRRAYEGGLRLMSALAVNNWLASSHPIKRLVLGSSQPEDDKGSGDVQVADIIAWAARPENRTWVEIGTTPAEARRIIESNKLAVVIGLELDVLGDFVSSDHFREPGVVVMPPDDQPALQRERIAAEVDRLYRLGVRQVGPFHYVSGMWGGAAMFQRLFNEVNRKITGRNVVVRSGAAEGIRYRLDMDAWDAAGMASRTLVTGDGPQLQTDPSWAATPLGHVNDMGLTQAGEILFDELARRGMLIDLDHASHLATDQMLDMAVRRDYPVMSSHSDYIETGFTGPGDFSHTTFVNNDEENARLFDTTILAPLRNEMLATRHKVETIAQLGGTTGPILWLPRRISWGHDVPDDCDGSSKTWAQNYQYAVDVTGGRGVALSTDRITIEPRFGPNAAYLLGTESEGLPHRDERRFAQVDAQSNGVRYDVPIRDWHAYRFAPVAGSAWSKTPLGFGWEEHPWEHGDAWKAIAAWSAGRDPRTANHGDIEPSGDPLHSGRVINYAWGLVARSEADLESDCGLLGCTPGTLDERYAAYCVKNNIGPHDLVHYTDAPGIIQHYHWVLTVWNEWQRMNGTNEPLRRHIFGNRDYDVNMDGVAHYGMLPDFLQDVANSHPRPSEVGMYFDPLFRSAEMYIRMWEKARLRAGLTDTDP